MSVSRSHLYAANRRRASLAEICVRFTSANDRDCDLSQVNVNVKLAAFDLGSVENERDCEQENF